MFITVSDVEPIVDILPVAVFTENLSASREIFGGHDCHDGAKDGVDREESVLSIVSEAMVCLVSQADSVSLDRAVARRQVYTEVVPHSFIPQSAVSLVKEKQSVPETRGSVLIDRVAVHHIFKAFASPRL